MKDYKPIISLSNNERGIWDLDTIKGCNSGINNNENGCYGDCYAYKTAKRYGINFSKSVNRYFINEAHRKLICNQIEKIDMPFIRIGCSGDPSEDWKHTFDIISKIRNKNQLSLFDISSKKQIVIITRHWNIIPDEYLNEISKYNICVNTSVSALDDNYLIEKSIRQYNRLKNYCKSVLRVVTCEFNLFNKEGISRNNKQLELLKNDNVIDTVFRPSKSNPFLVNEIIIARKMKFMNSVQLISKFDKKAYIGNCKNCIELCGIGKLK